MNERTNSYVVLELPNEFSQIGIDGLTYTYVAVGLVYGLQPLETKLVMRAALTRLYGEAWGETAATEEACRAVLSAIQAEAVRRRLEREGPEKPSEKGETGA